MPPFSTSISVGRRASTSWSIDGLCPYASRIASSTASARVAGQRDAGRGAQTASASSISRSTSRRSAGSVHTWPTVSPVSADSGLVAALNTTFVHCGPRASATACVRGRPR